MTPAVLSYSDIYLTLFNESSGACSKLDTLNLLDTQDVEEQFRFIETIWSNSLNIRNETNMVQIYERFIEWGCQFASKLMVLNVSINIVDNLLDYMTILYDYLPISSSVFHNSMFDKQTLMLLYGKFFSNSHTAPKIYIKIYTKLWLFCSKEIVNEELFCTIMVTLCDSIRNSRFDNFIGDLFDYAGYLLKMYIDKIGHKISSVLVTNKCITLVQVIVRSDKHAISRLYFWWQFICSVKKETMRRMIETCLIPFLANLFGKYITLDKEKKFDYTASRYNCFTKVGELGPLCNFVMNRILHAVIGILPRGLPKTTIRLSYLDNDLFKDNCTIEPYIDEFFVAFYYWCHFNGLAGKKLPFYLLNIVYTGFANRFLPTKDNTTVDTIVKVEPETFHSALFKIIEKCIIVKKLLESDLADLNRSSSTIFSEHSTIVTSIVISLTHLGSDPILISDGRAIIQAVFAENLSLMKRFLSVPKIDRKSITTELSGTWLKNSKDLISILLPAVCVIEHGFMIDDMDLIVGNWLGSFLDNAVTVTEKVGNSLWIDNIRLWCLLATKISTEFNKNNFTLNYVNECKELKSALDFLRAPILFLQELDQDLLDTDDFSYICEVHENLYHNFAIKAALIPSLNANEWCGELCLLLANQLSNGDMSFSNKQALLLNFVIRFIRIVVSYCDPIQSTKDSDTNYKKNPLWQCITALANILPMFDSSNLRLTLKALPPKERIFALESLPLAKKMTTISKQMQFAGDCDSEYSLGLALYSIERLIAKLGHNPLLITEATKTLSSNMAQVIDIGIRRKDLSSGKSRQKAQCDKDALGIEHAVVSVLKHIRTACHEENIMPVVNSIFCTLFSFPKFVISTPTMTFIIEYWNTFVMKNQDELGVKLSKELTDSLRNTKEFYPNLRLPKYLMKKMEISEEPVVQSMVDLNENQPKRHQFGSLLNKVGKNLPKKIENTINVTPTRVKLSRKQSFTISRQSSDLEYTVIASPPNKRRRLTEHQKEILSEQRNKFIPTMYNGLDEVPMPSLVSMDSDMTVSETNSNNGNDDNSSGSTIAQVNDLIESLDGNSQTVDCDMECNETPLYSEIEPLSVQSKETNSEVVNNQDDITQLNEVENYVEENSTKLQNIIDENSNKVANVLEEHNLNVSTVVENNNIHVSNIAEENNINVSHVIDENVKNVLVENSVKGLNIAQENSIKVSKVVEENNCKISNMDVENSIKISSSTNTAEEPKRRPLFERNPHVNSIRSPSVTGRTFRMVQMALQNQQKRKVDAPMSTQIVPRSEERQRPSSIMRHTWSECKKDVKVSFSDPLCHIKSEESSSKEDEENVDEVYLSPVFDRSRQHKRISFDSSELFGNDDPVTVESPRKFSVTCSDRRSAEKVRNSMELLSNEMSPIKNVVQVSQLSMSRDSAHKMVTSEAEINDDDNTELLSEACNIDALSPPATCQDDAFSMPATCQDDATLMPATCKDDAFSMPATCQDDAFSMPATCQDDAFSMPATCQDDAFMDTEGGEPRETSLANVAPPRRTDSGATNDQLILDEALRTVREALNQPSIDKIRYILDYLFNQQ